MTKTVPPTTDTDELTGYAATAAELRRIADALDTLPPTHKLPYVTLSILPEHTGEAVDAVALAVIGRPGQREKLGSAWFHIVRHYSAKTNVSVTVQTNVPDERDAELERLRAEVATLRSADYGHDRIDHGDATTPVPATVDGHAEFTGRATVPNGGE